MFQQLQGKKFLVTGHTGFKGGWLCRVLHNFGAKVYGYSLQPSANEKMYFLSDVSSVCEKEFFADVRDVKSFSEFFQSVRPDSVIHLAAQALVMHSYSEPLTTFDTNVIGTASVLEAVKDCNWPCCVICITTDKVYDNAERGIPFVETDRLGGYDPYSASKACAELVIDSYRKSFFNLTKYGKSHFVQLASVRAGNVIGGGDFAENRIIPDIIRAFSANKPVEIRNPTSIRPWQHVLEPVFGYVSLANSMLNGFNREFCSAFNFGPNKDSFKTVKYIVDYAASFFDGKWTDSSNERLQHEAKILKLDIAKSKLVLGWSPIWGIDEALERTFTWYDEYMAGKDVIELTNRQIAEYCSGSENVG